MKRGEIVGLLTLFCRNKVSEYWLPSMNSHCIEKSSVVLLKQRKMKEANMGLSGKRNNEREFLSRS